MYSLSVFPFLSLLTFDYFLLPTFTTHELEECGPTVRYSEKCASYSASLFQQFHFYDINKGTVYGTYSGDMLVSLVSTSSQSDPKLRLTTILVRLLVTRCEFRGTEDDQQLPDLR